jgi:alkaline phosphatase
MVGDYPLGRQVDVLLGGGLGFFLPNTTAGSSRKDSKDVLEIARSKGFSVFTNRAGFDALQGGNADAAKKPYLGLFTSSHMSYEVDRDPTKEPSLLEMTKTAIKSLEKMSKGQKKGFFLVSSISIQYSFSSLGHSYRWWKLLFVFMFLFWL